MELDRGGLSGEWMYVTSTTPMSQGMSIKQEYSQIKHPKWKTIYLTDVDIEQKNIMRNYVKVCNALEMGFWGLIGQCVYVCVVGC